MRQSCFHFWQSQTQICLTVEQHLHSPMAWKANWFYLFQPVSSVTEHYKTKYNHWIHRMSRAVPHSTPSSPVMWFGISWTWIWPRNPHGTQINQLHATQLQRCSLKLKCSSLPIYFWEAFSELLKSTLLFWNMHQSSHFDFQESKNGKVMQNLLKKLTTAYFFFFFF